MADKELEFDPEFLEIILQGVSVLSNVATIASTVIFLRGVSNEGRYNSNLDHLRKQLRNLRRALEDTFDTVESILRILEEARSRSKEPSPLTQPARFGSPVMLPGQDFQRVQELLTQLEDFGRLAREYARGLTASMNPASVTRIVDVPLSPEKLNEQLNSILFNSSSLGEAMAKLRLAQREAEDFIVALERALLGN
ncbi:hypothetical protein [Bradyrhizobium sp. HKCCYLS2033]|uniref:hypothetical protein n=1 Tax=Bradyrhizobium sp. HKCCYLS2033 TaxID=3420739 RepID=UPI003EC0DF22